MNPMTIRNSVSHTQNRWYDGQRVDQVDMTTEQNRNVNTDASIIQNHFGSGVLPLSASQNILFDTDNLFPDQVALIASNDFDGTGLRPLVQPSDTNLGNQLEVELKDSDLELNGITTVGGRLSTKVLVIGLDYQGNPQYDRFTFYKKEKQVTKKHYTRILSVFTNDFYGNNNCSRQLGGRVIIRETSSLQLSRDPVMIAQDVEPNLFFRDFKVSPTLTLFQAIQAGIGSEYSVDALNINTTVKRDVELIAGDVTTRLAQKFLAKSNNIQKITILLGVRKDTSTDIANQFNWSGELIVSVYELQSTVSVPTEIVPELAIEFDPNPEPLTQFSLDLETLRDQGYVLSDVLQPIDLVFNGSILGNTANPRVVPGRYYAISISRAGDAGTGILFTGIGNSQTTEDRFSIFSGEWTDVPEEDLWYQVWSDTAKIADGMAYDAGFGMQIAKTAMNDLGAVIDYAFDQKPFADSGQNTLNTAVIEAVTVNSQQEQDERTGNPVYARQTYQPQFSFVTNSSLATLRETSEPLVIGCARDTNAKANNTFTGIQAFPGLARGNTFKIVNPDVNILSQQLIGSKLIPSDICTGNDYKIVRTSICTDGYGDVNGDGQIDEYDVIRATQLLNESLLLTSTQQKINNGQIDTLELLRADVDGDGYITSNDVDLISNFVSRSINSFPVGASFTHIEIEVQNSTGRFDGYYDCDGYVRLDGYSNTYIDPNLLSEAERRYYGVNTLPDIPANDPILMAVPFVPVEYAIRPIPFWQDYLLQFSSEARLVPAIFSFAIDSSDYTDGNGQCAASDFSICREVSELGSSCNPGRNDFFIPDNLIIGKGQILGTDGQFFKVDLEIQTITLELPMHQFTHAVLNVFDKLVVDNGDGFTSAGFPAMKFSDCSSVQVDALIRNQLRFGVAIQSIYPNLDGYSVDDGYGVIIDNIIGIDMDQTTGILKLSMRDINHSSVHTDWRTKIQITVYMKKAGWNNTPLVVPYDQVAALFASGVT